MAEELGVSDPEHSFTAWFWDVDNDSDLDLMVNSYRTPQTAIPDIWYYTADLLGRSQPADMPRLYINEDGGFRDAAVDYGIARVTLASGANFGDLDNDGFLDFYLATGYPGVEAVLPNLMYRNDGGRRFVDVTYSGGFGHLQKGHGVTFADFDRDGDQDVFEEMGGAVPVEPFEVSISENRAFVLMQDTGTLELLDIGELNGQCVEICSSGAQNVYTGGKWLVQRGRLLQ